jgi:MFS family permease
VLDVQPTTAGEWRGHWPVVVSGAAGTTLVTLPLYSLGLMMGPLEQQFGWSRAQVSSGQAIVAIVGVVLAPLAGIAIDRFGARRIALLGALLHCGMVASLSTATANLWSWWILWSGIAVTAACVSPMVWTSAVSSLFFSARGLALALTLCGTGIGALCVPLASSYFAGSFGWRGGYVALASTWAAVTLPLIYFCFFSAKDKSRIDYPKGGAAAATVLSGVRATEAFASVRYFKLAVAACAIVIVSSSLTVNVVPILVSQGLSSHAAAAIGGLIGIGTIVGRLCGGYLLDRVNGNVVAGISVLIPIASCGLLIAFPGWPTGCCAAVMALGMALGVEYDAVAYLTARHFGVRSFGALFGTITGMLTLTNGMGPLLTNRVYDVTRSYDPALWVFIPICLLSSILFLKLGPYPDAGRAMHD